MSTPNIEFPEKSILEIAAFALDFVNDLYRWGKEVYADKEITPTEFNQLFNQVLEPAVANFTNNKVKVDYKIDETNDLNPEPVTWLTYIPTVFKIGIDLNEWQQKARADGKITPDELLQFIQEVMLDNLNDASGRYNMSFTMKVAD